MADLDPESLRAYRQMFAVVRPDHPWNAPDDTAFLKLIGGWRDDRDSGDTVLTMSWGSSKAVTHQAQVETPGKTPELVLHALQADPQATVPTLALQLGKSESAILRVIRKLREEGRLRRIGPDKGGRWEVVV